MSKLLKRALKLAILPACLLVVGKFVSVFTLIALNQIDYTIETTSSNLFSVQVYLQSTNDVVVVNSYSNLATLILIAIPTFYIILRKVFMFSAQDNPRTIVKLTRLNILKWVNSDKTPILNLAIWTVFLWIISSITIAASLTLTTHTWIGITAGIIAILSAWGLIRTFELETDKIYPRDRKPYYA